MSILNKSLQNSVQLNISISWFVFSCTVNFTDDQHHELSNGPSLPSMNGEEGEIS